MPGRRLPSLGRRVAYCRRELSLPWTGAEVDVVGGRWHWDDGSFLTMAPRSEQRALRILPKPVAHSLSPEPMLTDLSPESVAHKLAPEPSAHSLSLESLTHRTDRSTKLS